VTIHVIINLLKLNKKSFIYKPIVYKNIRMLYNIKIVVKKNNNK